VSETSVAPEGETLSQEPTVEAEPVTDYAAEATEYKNRFAGSQRKLTETLAEKAKIAEEVEALRKFKAEAEKANMTELERLQAERDEARREAATARSEAERAKLAAEFPLAVEVLGDEAPLSREVLSKLNAKLAALKTDETEDEPQIDPNHPRKTVANPAVDEMAAADRWLRESFN